MGLVSPAGERRPGSEAIAELAESVDAAAGRVLGRVVVCVGTDLVDIDDVRGILVRRPRFPHRYFTDREREYCLLTSDPAERFAARLAAKEAVVKALGVGLSGAALTDIEVVRRDSGQPQLTLTGRAAVLADAAGIRSWMITLAHSRHVAHAFVAGLSDAEG
jgi:holo-[acyl-carrier protein] synthase